MAKPRVFISSTFYDLKHVRSDLEKFIKDIGYEPVLYERGSVPWQTEKKLEDYCYKEIENCDILVAIIGGRYGSGSTTQPYSISQMELKTAFELGRQVYIFVERSVMYEYQTYLDNLENQGIKYHYVDDQKVFSFIKEIESLPKNNPIAPFDNSYEIVSYLKEQWAGLFKNLLQEQSREKEIRLIQQMEDTAKTLDQLVSYLSQQRDGAIEGILLSNHPAFSRLAKITNTQYRVFFTNRDEMISWLVARAYTYNDFEGTDSAGFEHWWKEDQNHIYHIHIYSDIFDPKGRLKVFTPDEWDKNWIRGERAVRVAPPSDDDIPF